MTLYRIFAGRMGIDYWETSKEIGLVEAETYDLAHEYAMTMPRFHKPDNGYDTTSSSEGRLQEEHPFVATRDNIDRLKAARSSIDEHQRRIDELASKKKALELEIQNIERQFTQGVQP